MHSRISNTFIQSFNDNLLNTCYMPGAMQVRDGDMLKSELLTSRQMENLKVICILSMRCVVLSSLETLLSPPGWQLACNFLNYIWFSVYVSMHLCPWMCELGFVAVSGHTCGGYKTAFRNQLSPSTVWIPKTDLRPSGLEASTSTSQAILPAQLAGNLKHHFPWNPSALAS